MTLAVGFFVAACAKPGTVKPEAARLQIIAEPETATVYIDGHFVGSARVIAAEPEALPPGLHLVTVQADDHFPHDLELELPEGTTTVRVKLRPRPK